MATNRLYEEFLPSREEIDVEAKAAQGRDGNGEVPGSIWESYSAMANTEGGVILLGVEEKENHQLSVIGIKHPDKVRKVLWDNLNNPEIVNRNLLRDRDIKIVDYEGKTYVWIQVPRAGRAQRPIYVGKNPMSGTYRRDYEGDYHCDDPTVRRMIAEAIEDARDSKLLPGFTLNDLDKDSLTAYRNEFRSTKPGHPWVGLGDQELLRNLGGWVQDRQSTEEGLTLAGLLMFGKQPAILEAVPNYLVDYQERPMPPAKVRWLDRVTTDGSWSGNIYDFYRRVYPRLISDLKVPFRLERATKRIDETDIHEALREAFVNVLIHADFSGRVGILVVKRPDFFGFRNPGGLRLPLQVVLAGGTSDCRNRSLQKMFQLIGEGEQAGPGIPKILRAWSEQHWRRPLLYDDGKLEQTVLRLPMVSLLPQEAVTELDRRFGARFRELDDVERIAVVTALVENKVTNERLRNCTPQHRSDVTAMFRSLVDRGFLVSDGVGRGTYYHLPGATADGDISLFDPASEVPDKSGRASPTLPEPVISLSPEVIAVLALLKRRIGDEKLTRLMNILHEQKHARTRDVAELLDVVNPTARRYLNELANAGLIREQVKSKFDPNGVWMITDASFWSSNKGIT